MLYYKQLGITRFIADIRISCYRMHLKIFVDLISSKYKIVTKTANLICCKHNIINKIAKANTHRYHTIQNNYSIVSYQNYILLYCKGRFQVTSNNTNINVDMKRIMVNKIKTTHSICSQFILDYRY